MKKTLSFAVVTLLLTACTGGGIKGTLKRYVVENSKPVNVKYKLVDFVVTDTVTVGEAVDSLCEELFLDKDKKPDSTEFRKLRNQEFTDFHPYFPDYEEQVMRGELRDASSWTTLIRQVTESADSLLAVWDKVTWHSYDYNRLYWWYKARWAYFYDQYGELAYTSYANYVSDLMDESRERFALLDSLLTADTNAVYRYTVEHTYTIYNPLFQARVRLVDEVHLNDKLEYVDSDTQHFGFDK